MTKDNCPITLNKPEKQMLFAEDGRDAKIFGLDEATNDNDIKVIILKGADIILVLAMI
jgi:1,4-dihydroxy-2-naphthoyl-CoA synthase